MTEMYRGLKIEQQLILTSRDLMDRGRCESLAKDAAKKWNDDVRRFA